MNKIGLPLLLSIALLSLNLVLMGYVPHEDIYQSYLHNQAAFAFELVGQHWRHPEPWIHNWFFGQEAPFKYRLLAKIPIYLSYRALNVFWHPLPALYGAYLVWCWLFLALVLRLGADLCVEIVNRSLPEVAGHERRIRFLAVVVFALCPPLLFAFKFPVHGGPNDLLGYALIALSCLSLIREQYRLFLVWMLLSVPCRETNLIMLLPFLMLRKPHWPFRIGVAAIVLGVSLAYRWFWSGSYNPFLGARHNLQYPLESLFFLFLVFAPLWLLGVLGFVHLRRKIIDNDAVNAFVRSFPYATVAVLVVTFALARVREIRIEFVLFFYFIPFSIVYLWREWPGLLTTLKSKRMVPVLILTALLTFRMWLYFLKGFGGDWRASFLAYFALTLLLGGTILAARWGVETVKSDLMKSD